MTKLGLHPHFSPIWGGGSHATNLHAKDIGPVPGEKQWAKMITIFPGLGGPAPWFLGFGKWAPHRRPGYISGATMDTCTQIIATQLENIQDTEPRTR